MVAPEVECAMRIGGIQSSQGPAMSNLTVTEARLVDVPAMVELLQQLFSQEQDFEPNPTRQAAAIALILTHPYTDRLFVATRDARVLGMVSCGWRYGESAQTRQELALNRT